MPPHLEVFATRDVLMSRVAAELAGHVNAALAQYGDACIALSGGATPAPAYELFAMLPLEWNKVSVLLVDERFVPPQCAGSNEAMLRTSLAPALDRGAQLIPLYGPGASLDEAAARADARYAGRRIDIALLGMGEDGHTASWFPGASALASALDLDNPRAVVGINAGLAAALPERLTLTRAALARAKAVILLITGEAKSARLEAALAGAEADAPVAALFRAGPEPRVMWAP